MNSSLVSAAEPSASEHADKLATGLKISKEKNTLSAAGGLSPSEASGEAVSRVACLLLWEKAPQGAASSSLGYLHLAAAATRALALLLSDQKEACAR
jgi:hypothetical protein